MTRLNCSVQNLEAVEGTRWYFQLNSTFPSLLESKTNIFEMSYKVLEMLIMISFLSY